MFKEKNIEEEIQRLNNVTIGASKGVQEFLEEYQSTLLKTGTNLAELIKRPELSYELLEALDPNRKPLSEDVIEQININIKYEGYIKRQQSQVTHFNKLEKRKIPKDIDYNDVKSLRIEARQKLISYQPVSIGQASRISGVSPADISVLLVYMEQYGKYNHKNG